MPSLRSRIGDPGDTNALRAAAPKAFLGFREIFGPLPSRHLTEEQRAQRFWMGELYSAVFGYWVVGFVCLGYAALTLHQPNRYWIVANVVFAMIFAAACYAWRYRIVALSWRVWFFGAWNANAFAALAFLCVLDGGVGSVLTFLQFLPLLYLATGYPLRTVQICGGIGVLSYGITVLNTSAPILVAIVVPQSGGWLVGYLLALSGAANRRRQEQEAYRMRQQLEMLAITDDLTGCLNHRAFVEALDRESERAARYGYSVALLTIDIDHFKQINDNHGHLMGDEVLRQIGLRLRGTARDSDIAGRPGGDELALLAPVAEAAEARALAERLHQEIETLKVPVAITLSIGICLSSQNAEPAATLFRRADQALYEAKRRGRDQTVVFGESSAANGQACARPIAAATTRKRCV